MLRLPGGGPATWKGGALCLNGSYGLDEQSKQVPLGRGATLCLDGSYGFDEQSKQVPGWRSVVSAPVAREGHGVDSLWTAEERAKRS